jgi:hypothetical protein
MTRRSGSADLPLHGGRVPKWLGDRMTRLGVVIAEAIVLEYGRDELLPLLWHHNSVIGGPCGHAARASGNGPLRFGRYGQNGRSRRN